MENKEINLLLLGASGSGKSSFAKTFLLHADHIDSANDGQTTRSNIIYDLSLFEEKPLIQVKFFNKDDFLRRMTQLNYAEYLLKVINLLEDKKDERNLLVYLMERALDKQTKEEEKNDIKNFLSQADTDLKINEERYGKVCDILGNELRSICNQIEKSNILDFTKKNLGKLNEILSRVEGFFDVSEFNFLIKGFDYNCYEMLESQKDKVEKDKLLVEYYESYYKKFHEVIIEKLKELRLVSSNHYFWEISLDSTEKLDEMLTYCLQAKEGKSLTGIVDYVHIKDSISNDFSFIMDDLGITNLKLFDTYGLDHADWEGDKGKILSDVLYTLQEKKLLLFNSDLSIIYVKKLDSGKPTELQSIIPQIFKMIPQAPVYCLLNGLDIYLGPQVETFSGFEYSDDLYIQNKPKSMVYLESDKFEEDVKNNTGNNNLFIDYLCKTLKNNIILYCSNNSVIEENINILDTNRKGIHKLLVSICMKEYSSMNIIPNQIIEKIKNGEFNQQIKNLIQKIFKKSSKTNWTSEHWKTSRANYDRTSNSERDEIGYWGTYNHRWNQLFHQGYVRTIIDEASDFLHIEDKKYAYALDACIKNMEEDFLGGAFQLAYRKYKGPKSKFRNLIEKMYEEGESKGIYFSNPFFGNYEFGVPETEYLNNICDFSKGYHLITEDLLLHFKECLVKTIEQENKGKSVNLLKINYEFYSQLNRLKYIFNKAYPDIEFYDLLKYYSDSFLKKNDAEIR